MRFEAFDAWVRTLPGAMLDLKWEDHRTYCVGGKMFVMAGALGDPEPAYMFKASELGFEILVESGAAGPAPYLGRARWVRMAAADSLTDDEVRSYVAEAHRLIAAKLTKKLRAELGVA